MDLIRHHMDEVTKACISSHVERLFAFGSILSDHFSEESDVDLLVSIDLQDPIEYGESYFQLKFQLEKILGRKVDLLEEQAIRNDVFKSLINNEKVLIYARGNTGLA